MNGNSDSLSPKNLIIGFIFSLIATVIGGALVGEGRFTNFNPTPIQWVALAALAIAVGIITVKWQSALKVLRMLGRFVRAAYQWLVAKRAWRPIIVILAIVSLGFWIHRNLLIQPLHPLSGWIFWQYVLAIAQIVLLALLLAYTLLGRIKWHKSGNLFWAGDNLMRAIHKLSRDDINSEDIANVLQQSLYHIQELGFSGSPIESKLTGLTAGAGSTLGQDQIWTQWREFYKDKLASLADEIGDCISGDQKRRVGFFNSGPKGDKSRYASYSFERDFRSGLKDAWTTPSEWWPKVDNKRGVLLVHHDDLQKMLLLEELPLFMNGLIECEVYLELGALFDVMLRGSLNVTQPRSPENEFYMARFDTRGGDQLDCILIKPEGTVDWSKCDRGEHTSSHGKWLTMRIVADGRRISLYSDGDPVSQIGDAKVTTGRIGLFAEMANVYVRKIRISPKFPWDA